MKILITSGATVEYIDGARFITNFSTGGTGRVLADELSGAGHKVTALCGLYARRPAKAKVKIFTDFKDLNARIKKILAAEKFDLIVHLAAVSDFSVDKIKVNGKFFKPGALPKIPSGSKLEIKLKNNFKIIDKLKSYAKNKPFVVGFKLTNKANAAEVLEAVSKVRADIAVHNDLAQIRRGKRVFTVYKNGVKLATPNSAPELAKFICALCSQIRRSRV